MLSVVTEVLSHGSSSVRSKELKRSGVGGGGSDNDGVFESVSLLEESHDVGNGRSLLTNGDVDAVEGLAVVSGLKGGLLVKDSVNSNSGLTGLTISDDKLSLTSSNWDLYSVVS